MAMFEQCLMLYATRCSNKSQVWIRYLFIIEVEEAAHTKKNS